MSCRMRARWAGSPSRASIFSRPPSRTHKGRHASSPLEARVYGYVLAVTSRPRRRRLLDPAQHVGHLSPVGFVRRFQCQISAGIFARPAIANTSSSDSPILLDSERWWVIPPPVRGRHLRQLHDLVGGGESVRNVLQGRAEAQRSVFHGLRDQAFHLFELRRRRAAIVFADHEIYRRRRRRNDAMFSAGRLRLSRRSK